MVCLCRRRGLRQAGVIRPRIGCLAAAVEVIYEAREEARVSLAGATSGLGVIARGRD